MGACVSPGMRRHFVWGEGSLHQPKLASEAKGHEEVLFLGGNQAGVCQILLGWGGAASVDIPEGLREHMAQGKQHRDSLTRSHTALSAHSDDSGPGRKQVSDVPGMRQQGVVGTGVTVSLSSGPGQRGQLKLPVQSKLGSPILMQNHLTSWCWQRLQSLKHATWSK